MTDHSSLTKQRTESLLAAAQERAPHIDWGVFATHGPAIIGALPNGRGSVLVMQYGPSSYTLRHKGIAPVSVELGKEALPTLSR